LTALLNPYVFGGVPVGGDFTIVGTTPKSVMSTTSTVFTLPTPFQTGDIAFIIARMQGTVTTAPAGWSGQYTSSFGSYVVYTKILLDTDSPDVPLALHTVAAAVVIRGPTTISLKGSQLTTSGNTRTITGFTKAVDSKAILALSASNDGSSVGYTLTPPTGFTVLENTGFAHTLAGNIFISYSTTYVNGTNITTTDNSTSSNRGTLFVYELT
jgi:hypothetical protein